MGSCSFLSTLAFASTLLRLSRVDSCLLAFLAVLIPVAYHSESILVGVTRALPVLPIAMCGFVINDVNDIEKDMTNHPERPLPRREMQITTAVIYYFVLLATSLVLIRIYVFGPSVFYYILFCVGMINYNIVVNHFPKIKNIYVASVTIIPIMIAIDSSGLGGLYYTVAISLALFIIGRELLMDVHDSEGDLDSLAIAIGLKMATLIAFAIQYISLTILVPLSLTSPLKIIVLIVMFGMSTMFVVLWKTDKCKHRSIMLMKLQMLMGLTFLA